MTVAVDFRLRWAPGSTDEEAQGSEAKHLCLFGMEGVLVDHLHEAGSQRFAVPLARSVE